MDVFQHAPKCRIIIIGNMKGGVGKTTTTKNLASTIAHRGQKVLIIDLDPQTNLTQQFVKIRPNSRSVMDIICGSRSAKSCIHKTKNANIDIIMGKKQVFFHENDVTDVHALKKALEPVKQDYSYILIDTRPALFEPITFSGLASADILLTPINLEGFSLQNLLDVEEGLNAYNLDCRWMIFVNKFRMNPVQRKALKQLDQTDFPILENVIEDKTILSKINSTKKTVFQLRSAESDTLKQDYEDLLSAIEERG